MTIAKKTVLITGENRRHRPALVNEELAASQGLNHDLT